MRKTRLAGPQGPSIGRLSTIPSNWAPLTLFAVAYLAVLGVLFAPEGFFTTGTPAAVTAD